MFVVMSRTAKISAVLCLLGALAVGAPAQAAPPTTLEVNGTATATSTVGASIVAGDVFTWSVTFDLDAASTGSSPSFGNTFNDSVQAFTLERSAGNVGTWDPAGVVWPITPAMNVATNVNSDTITVQLIPQGAPALDGVAFRDMGLTLDWNQSDLDAVWTAGTTSLATWLGTTTPPLEAASYFFELRDTNFQAATFTAAVVVPPPPTTAPPLTVPQALTTMPVPTTTMPVPSTTMAPTTTTTIEPQTTVPTAALDAAAIAAAPDVDLGAQRRLAGGEQVTLTATGFIPGAGVDVYLASTPVLLGNATADDAGTVVTNVAIPLGYEGTHSLVVFDPATGTLLRQVVEIAPAILPSTGVSDGPTILLGGMLIMLFGAVLMTRSWRQRPECPNPPPR